MNNGAFNMAGLSQAQIEERLGQPGLSGDERDALVEELSNRLAEELVAGRGTPSPTPQPRPQYFRPPQRQPDPEAWGRSAAPRQAPRIGPSDGSTDATRKGFSRSLASLLALFLVMGGAGVVITLLKASEGPEPVNPVQSSAGPAGTTQVGWTLGGVAYIAKLETTGPAGVADVTFANPQSGLRLTVREDLRLERTDGEWRYTGDNPRDTVNGAPVPSYSPDIFWLRTDGTSWYFTRVCDTSGACAAADTTVR